MNDTVSRFMNNMKTLNQKDYMFNLITYGIAPTICGYKSSTLITLSKRYKNTYELWKTHREELLENLPLSSYELNKTEEAYTVLFYNEKELKERITQKENIEFLKAFGYKDTESLEVCLNKLRERYRKGCPHEIGIFLDIPLNDVLGFVNNNGKNYDCCGYWKVYSDVDKAVETFKKYDISKKIVLNLIGQGKNTYEVIKELLKIKEA